MPVVIGLDVAQNNIGWVAVELANGKPSYLDSGCISARRCPPQKSKVAELIYKVSEMVRSLLDVLERYRPVAVVGELPTGAKSYMAARALGVVYGVMAAVRAVSRVPVEWVTPQAVKRATTGRVAGTKEQVQAAVLGWYPEMGGGDGLEHRCDAMAAVLAALEGEVLPAVVRAVGGLSENGRSSHEVFA